MPPLPRLAVGAVALLAAAGGCSAPLSTPGGPRSTAAAANAGPVELTEVTSAGMDRAIQEQRGKVVLLDAWFAGCSPCRKKFPHVVELAHKYGPDGLTVMSVDVYEEELTRQAEVLAFLKEQRATFPNFILKDPDVFMAKYGFEETPTVILIGRDGRRVDIPRSPKSLEEIEPAIRAALAAGA